MATYGQLETKLQNNPNIFRKMYFEDDLLNQRQRWADVLSGLNLALYLKNKAHLPI
jgi:hypothetical protein